MISQRSQTSPGLLSPHCLSSFPSLLSFLVCIFFTLSVSAAGGGPHFQASSGTVDLGTVCPDSPVSGELEFTNTGDTDLTIFSVFTDCGCTSTSFPTETVAPGESAKIEISFNAKGRRPGSFRKAIRVRSNADNPRFTFFVIGTVSY